MRRFRHRFSLWLRTARVRLLRKRAEPARRRSSRRTPAAAARRRAVIIAAVAVLVLVLIGGNYYVQHHLRPIMTQMARVQVDQLASRVINEAIVRRIAGEGIAYGNLVYFEKDIYGQITALRSDIISINRLKAGITEEVLSSLEHADTSRLSIPIGNLINGDVLSGRGPRIPLKIVPLGTVSASFSNQFSAAGINQTRHQIMMEITVDITVLLPGYSVGTQVGTQVSIAETIIVGAVPDSYFQMEDVFGRS
ncbi:MAG: sporulation protein YunB [Oscillospiraceae bacterium]|jgi:sporulation protein YunB|nr:sporulation protein YunB [Oscillospiraceae bacterium]